MAIESEVEVLKTVVSKLDASIEKIAQVSGDIGKILAVHEQRLDSIEKVSDKRSEEIKELHSRITTQTREIVDKIDKMEQRLEDKMALGAAAAKTQHEEIQKEIQKDIAKVASRVDILEQWRWYILGAAGTVGFILGNLDLLKFLK